MGGERRTIDWRHSNRPWAVAVLAFAGLSVALLTMVGEFMLGLMVGAMILGGFAWLCIASSLYGGMEHVMDS